MSINSSSEELILNNYNEESKTEVKSILGEKDLNKGTASVKNVKYQKKPTNLKPVLDQPTS